MEIASFLTHYESSQNLEDERNTERKEEKRVKPGNLLNKGKDANILLNIINNSIIAVGVVEDVVTNFVLYSVNLGNLENDVADICARMKAVYTFQA